MDVSHDDLRFAVASLHHPLTPRHNALIRIFHQGICTSSVPTLLIIHYITLHQQTHRMAVTEPIPTLSDYDIRYYIYII
jgi:hypothetical protein